MENNYTALFIVLGIITLLSIYWSIRGLIQIFQRHNTILVIAYIIFLFPVAYIHMLFLGIFGASKKRRILKRAKAQAKFDKLVEEEKKAVK